MTSDNNHIIYSADDIQRYWKGQLSPQEMHAMEKAALDDPFLADAMEGFGQAMQQHDENLLYTHLGELRAQLQQSAGSKPRAAATIRWFRWWQAAAAVFVLAVTGYFIFSPGHSNQHVVAVKQKNADSGQRDRMSDQTAANKVQERAPAADTIHSQELTWSRADKRRKSEEPGYYEFKTNNPEKKQDSAAYLNFSATVSQPSTLPPLSLPDLKKQKRDQAVAGRSAAVANTDSVRKMETEVIQVKETLAALDKDKEAEKKASIEPKLQNVISGIVTDNKNNPLPNVVMRLDDKNSYTTDPSGSFKIPVSDTVVNVSVSLQGYATQYFLLRSNYNGAGSLADNQIRLQSNDELAASQRLSQGYYNKKASGKYDNEMAGPLAKIAEQDAQPVYGWLTYEQYLEKNKRIPASNPNLKGEVAISFEINKKGERSKYKIERPLSPDYNAEALRLIIEGPEWKLNKGRKSRVTVIVRF